MQLLTSRLRAFVNQYKEINPQLSVFLSVKKNEYKHTLTSSGIVLWRRHSPVVWHLNVGLGCSWIPPPSWHLTNLRSPAGKHLDVSANKRKMGIRDKPVCRCNESAGWWSSCLSASVWLNILPVPHVLSMSVQSVIGCFLGGKLHIGLTSPSPSVVWDESDPILYDIQTWKTHNTITLLSKILMIVLSHCCLSISTPYICQKHYHGTLVYDKCKFFFY